MNVVCERFFLVVERARKGATEEGSDPFAGSECGRKPTTRKKIHALAKPKRRSLLGRC